MYGIYVYMPYMYIHVYMCVCHTCIYMYTVAYMLRYFSTHVKMFENEPQKKCVYIKRDLKRNLQRRPTYVKRDPQTSTETDGRDLLTIEIDRALFMGLF